MRANENLTIRVDNQEDSTTNVPTLATQGIAVPSPPPLYASEVSLDVVKTAGGGQRDIQIRVYGYRSAYVTQAANGKKSSLVETGYWVEIFDTGAVVESIDFGKSWLFSGCHGFDRLATVIDTNSGSSPKLTTYFSFGGERVKS